MQCQIFSYLGTYYLCCISNFQHIKQSMQVHNWISLPIDCLLLLCFRARTGRIERSFSKREQIYLLDNNYLCYLGESYFVRTILKDGCKISYYALPLHRENVGSMGFSNEHDVASQHSLTYLKREVIGVYTRIKRGEIFFNFPNLKLDIGYQQIYLSYKDIYC